MDTPEDTTQPSGFETLGLAPALVEALKGLGYEEPTPIQKEAIPALLEGRDIIGLAATGTGKTAAFSLPILTKIKIGAAGPHQTSALVLVPTRELAVQVAEAMHSYGKGMGVRVLPVYGGQDIKQQLRRLRQGVDVVVATPGRAMDHLKRETLKFDALKFVVLDEADEMLDMGFAEDLETILGAMPEERQTALFSATLPPRITKIAEDHLVSPVRVRIERESVPTGEVPRVRQVAYIVPRAHKRAALGRLLDIEAPTSAIIFCRTRTEVDELTDALQSRGYSAEALHGGMSQEQRDRVLKKFKSHSTEVLIATDVAARGLHVENLSHVVNYDLPTSAEPYVHRIGRTGRAGKEGVAISLVDARETRLLRGFERLTGQKIEIAQIPTVADLRARQLELTVASLREVLMEGELDAFRSVVEALGTEHDVMNIALAAVKLVHQQTHESRESDEKEIPTAAPARDRGPRTASSYADRGPPRGREGARREGAPWGSPDRASRDRAPREYEGADRPARKTSKFIEGGARPEGIQDFRPGRRSVREAEPEGTRKPRPARDDDRGESTVRVFIGAGRAAGMRPADLVGAIANEGGLESRRIGAIEIADRHSYVELPIREAPRVVEVLRNATLRGRKVMVRIDRGR